MAGGRHVRVIDNRFTLADGKGTFANSCVFIEAVFAKVSDVTIAGNWLEGGNYTVYVINDKRTPTGLHPAWYPQRVNVDYNQASRWRFGPWQVNEPGGFKKVIGPNNRLVQE